MRADAVTPELRSAVLARDGGCVAAQLSAPGTCRSRSGYPHPFGGWPDQLELDHVSDQPTLGRRAPSDPAHLVALCHHHHQGGWATSHRPLLREYLRRVAAGATPVAVTAELRGLAARGAL